MATAIPYSHRDLLDQQTGVLATVGGDGRPQQSVVWFLASEVDGETVVQISLHTDRQKTRNLRARPVIGLVVVDPATSMRYIEVRGDPQIADDVGYVLPIGSASSTALTCADSTGQYKSALL